MNDPAMAGTLGYVRQANDAYWTPAWCTQALLDEVTFRGAIWEPAAGAGHIVEVLKANKYKVFATDIASYGFAIKIRDFLDKESYLIPPWHIITNPPYDKAEQFIRHALDYTKPSRSQVAMLLRHEYDCAASRRDLFEHPAFHKKLILTRRPKWFDDKASPRHNFSWFIWDWLSCEGPPTMAWGPK